VTSAGTSIGLLAEYGTTTDLGDEYDVRPRTA